MKRLTLFALDSIQNVGDEILGDVTSFLIKKVDKTIEINECQLMPSYKNTDNVDRLFAILSLPLKYLSCFFNGNNKYRITNWYYYFKYHNYFKKCIINADYVMFSVGMFKYSTQNFSYIYHHILSICNSYKKPVFISAASVEIANKSDWRFWQLKRSLCFDSLKCFTTRDGIMGLQTLKEYPPLQQEKCFYDFVGDPALWIPECYGIPLKTKRAQERPFVGVNLIRPNIFRSYGHSLTGGQLIDFYKELINELKISGLNYELFCNGMEADYYLGLRLINEMDLPDNVLAPPTHNGKEYALNMLKYDVVFGARLHSCITAFSLGIPLAGIIWDKKIDCFSKTMNIRQFFSEENELEPKKVVCDLLKSFDYCYDEIYHEKDFYKMKTFESIKFFLSQEWKQDN